MSSHTSKTVNRNTTPWFVPTNDGMGFGVVSALLSWLVEDRRDDEVNASTAYINAFRFTHLLTYLSFPLPSTSFISLEHFFPYKS